MTTIEISAGELSLRLEADSDGRLRQIGFRPVRAGEAGIERGQFPPEAFPLAYPAWGEETGAAPALRLEAHDGRPGCYLTLDGYGGNELAHRVRLVDSRAAVEVELCWRTWPDDGVLEQWTEVRHSQPGPITLYEAAARRSPTRRAQPTPACWLASCQTITTEYARYGSAAMRSPWVS